MLAVTYQSRLWAWGYDESLFGLGDKMFHWKMGLRRIFWRRRKDRVILPCRFDEERRGVYPAIRPTPSNDQRKAIA